METNPIILYVDDEQVNLMLFNRLFSKKYKVYTADSGDDGLLVLNEYPEIKIVISDMKMPGMSGLEFIVQAKELFPDNLYYILTGFQISKEIQESLEKGVIHKYFQKPLNLKEIDDSILYHLNLK